MLVLKGLVDVLWWRRRNMGRSTERAGSYAAGSGDGGAGLGAGTVGLTGGSVCGAKAEDGRVTSMGDASALAPGSLLR